MSLLWHFILIWHLFNFDLSGLHRLWFSLTWTFTTKHLILSTYLDFHHMHNIRSILTRRDFIICQNLLYFPSTANTCWAFVLPTPCWSSYYQMSGWPWFICISSNVKYQINLSLFEVSQPIDLFLGGSSTRTYALLVVITFTHHL